MTQLLISPSGVLTNVPDNQAEDALKDGFKAAPTESSPDKVYGVSPTGVLTELHPDEAKQAFKDGFTPFEDILRKQNEISQARAKGEAGQEVLPGDENKNRFPFARAADQIKNFVTGDKPIPANFNLQDENGNYHLLDQDKNPILISHDKVTDYLIQNPTAEFQDPQLQTAYLARLQEASESKSEESKTAAAEQGFLNKKVWGVIPTVYDDYVSDPSVSPGHKLSLIASKVADTTGATGTLGEKLAYEGAGLALDIATNPLPQIVGNAAGEILPKAATLLGRVGRGAAIGAAEGAAFSTPQAIAQATLDKDPAGAAETLAFNTLSGGFLGGAMQGAAEVTSAIKYAINSPEAKKLVVSGANKAMAEALNQTENEAAQFGANKKNIPVEEEAARKYKLLMDHIETKLYV